jgi:hypothetical protein
MDRHRTNKVHPVNLSLNGIGNKSPSLNSNKKIGDHSKLGISASKIAIIGNNHAPYVSDHKLISHHSNGSKSQLSSVPNGPNIAANYLNKAISLLG